MKEIILQNFLPYLNAVGGGVEPPTVWLAKAQNFGGQSQSTKKDGFMLRLSQIHHPRDRRAWLPISSPYNSINESNEF